MSELGISDEQFVAACQKAEANPIHKKIVDQIMAVDSFLAFKRLMVKRNNELNKQAMELYEKATAAKTAATGATTATGMPKDTTAENATPVSEEEKKKQAAELREVMRVAQSLERAEEEEMMKRAMEESERHKTEAEKAREEEEAMIKQAIEMSEREEKERLAKVNA